MNLKKLSKITDQLAKHRISDGSNITKEQIDNFLLQDVLDRIKKGETIYCHGADRPGEDLIISSADELKSILEEHGNDPGAFAGAYNLDVEDPQEVETFDSLMEIIEKQTSGDLAMIRSDWNDTGDVMFCGFISAEGLKELISNEKNDLYIPFGWYSFLFNVGVKSSDFQFVSMCEEFWIEGSFKDEKLLNKVYTKYEDVIESVDYWDFLKFNSVSKPVEDSTNTKSSDNLTEIYNTGDLIDNEVIAGKILEVTPDTLTVETQDEDGDVVVVIISKYELLNN